MNDKDVKIFGQKPQDDSVDSIALIAEMNTQRSNGNTAKAKQLGKQLATMFLDEKQLHSSLESVLGKLDYPQPITFQIKILMFFTAEYCINRFLPNTLLKSTAINTIYDSIMKNAGDFYSEFSDGVEYSFYYLAVKKEPVASSIGTTFSMLCRKENDSEFQSLGTDTFTVVSKEVEKIIDSFNFIK